MSRVAAMRAVYDEISTIEMSTTELLQNAYEAMRWRDEAGESPVEILAEHAALRFWEALDTRLRAGEPLPEAWLRWPA